MCGHEIMDSLSWKDRKTLLSSPSNSSSYYMHIVNCTHWAWFTSSFLYVTVICSMQGNRHGL